MTAWDIKPEGVKTVLEGTHTEALPLQEHAKVYSTAMTELNDVGYDGEPECGIIVGVPLADFVQHYEYAFTSIAAQVIASLNGAADATVAYMQGQHDMALSAQKSSRDAGPKAAEAARVAAADPAAQAQAAEAQHAATKDAMEHSDAVGYKFLRWVNSVTGEVTGGSGGNGGNGGGD